MLYVQGNFFKKQLIQGGYKLYFCSVTKGQAMFCY